MAVLSDVRDDRHRCDRVVGVQGGRGVRVRVRSFLRAHARPLVSQCLAGGMLRLRPSSRLGYLERPRRARMASPAWQLTSPPTPSAGGGLPGT